MFDKAFIEQTLDKICDDRQTELQQEICEAVLNGPEHDFWQRVLFASDFVVSFWQRRPESFQALMRDTTLKQTLGRDDFDQVLRPLLSLKDEQAFDNALRYWRQYWMTRFITRDIHRLCSTGELMQELSHFADSAISVAVDYHHQRLCQKYGLPIGHESGEEQRLLVLGMGKLGAYELNLSSDIDLIFAYPEAGFTNGKKEISNHKFFLKLGQQVIKSLDKITGEGFVFRVDMRLRPYGQSGALALNFDALELYYEEQGREWERYAMIKARVITGTKEAKADITERLRPFVFRKYTDFSAIQALRDMKAMINREVKRLGKENDVKLGAGGIREVEFIAQAYQLIYGGRDEPLQQRALVPVLHALAERGILAKDEVSRLLKAYVFLRNSEHAIQGINDEHSQQLPQDEHRQNQFLAYLGFERWENYQQQLYQHRNHVREMFERVFADTQEQLPEEHDELKSLWLEADIAAFKIHCHEQGFTDKEIDVLVAIKQDEKVQSLASIAQERLSIFMPTLMALLLDDPERGDALASFVKLLYAVLRRTAYLVLLNENPLALERLYDLAKSSPWILEQMIRHPVLIDELLTAEGLGKVPDSQTLRALLQQQGLRIEVDDIEEQMQMLRYFKLSHHLHIVAAELSGKLPLMKVSDYLSFLAEAILDYVMQLAFAQMVHKFGFPSRDGEPCQEAEFAIIAYGKLGGLELSHSSDLDLVFLYDADDQGETDGDKKVDNRKFYTRMGQRIIHILSTQTVLGQIYDIDMRLRPSGGKGLLVSSIRAFDKYQKEQAWTWEHQALVRGRAVSGGRDLVQKFQAIRERELCKARDNKQLMVDVLAMREKMYQHSTPKVVMKQAEQFFHLKHSRGGMVDIEFMVQYCVLAFSHQYPELTRFTDNIRILEVLAQTGLIPSETTENVIHAYRYYRSLGHSLALKQAGSIVGLDEVREQQTIVLAYWNELFNKANVLTCKESE